ncbi:MAG TPA: 4Fe-4S dicluster domain-containing protein [Candidatus Lokiarchaeia archaeon]|nr:4Fe-4S dicluster domain-containing protein [Candidatus Lokiarchaeia archaeon]
MNEKILLKEKISDVFDALKGENDIIAPVKTDWGIEFRQIENPEDIALDYLNSKVPPKAIWLPKVETLYEYEIDGKDVKIKTPPEKLGKKVIVLGIRPCDAHSIKILDTFFKQGSFEDDLFQKRKENLSFIGLGCNSPRETCFCTSVAGSPFNKQDVDVFLTDLGEKYLVETISDNGEALIQQLPWLEDSSEADIELAKEQERLAEDSIKTQVNLENTSKLLDNNFYNAVWDEISATCLGCGSCSFFCPTCHCFDVIDENDYANHRGRRIRVWDTCQSPLFTLQTSGYNPRTSQKERCRQRLEHKFCYYPENYGIVGCVGCGRCIAYCPVNNDVRDIIAKVNNIEPRTEEAGKT